MAIVECLLFAFVGIECLIPGECIVSFDAGRGDLQRFTIDDPLMAD